MKQVWDERKDAANAAEHGISFEVSRSKTPSVFLTAPCWSGWHYGEQRVIAYWPGGGPGARSCVYMARRMPKAHQRQEGKHH